MQVQIKDYLGNRLSVGDRVVFHDGTGLTDGVIRSFFYEINDNSDISVPPSKAVRKIEPVDGVAETGDSFFHSIMAYIAYGEDYQTDHYGHVIGDPSYTRYKAVGISDTIKKATED